MDPEYLVKEIPGNSFLANEVFKTDIIDKKYKDRFIGKKNSPKNIMIIWML